MDCFPYNLHQKSTALPITFIRKGLLSLYPSSEMDCPYHNLHRKGTSLIITFIRNRLPYFNLQVVPLNTPQRCDLVLLIGLQGSIFLEQAPRELTVFRHFELTIYEGCMQSAPAEPVENEISQWVLNLSYLKHREVCILPKWEVTLRRSEAIRARCLA